MAVDYNVTEVDGSPSEPSHEKEKKGERIHVIMTMFNEYSLSISQHSNNYHHYGEFDRIIISLSRVV